MTQVKVTVRNNGPMRIEGAIELLDHEGRPFGLGGRTVLALCRCSQSSDPPFCDGAHKKTGFQSVCSARDLPPPVAKP